jgi:hypothetical protein
MMKGSVMTRYEVVCGAADVVGGLQQRLFAVRAGPPDCRECRDPPFDRLLKAGRARQPHEPGLLHGGAFLRPGKLRVLLRPSAKNTEFTKTAAP